MKHNFIIFLFLNLLAFNQAQATVDYLVVNHMTHQLYWADSDHPPGWIAWENIPDDRYEGEEVKFLEAGYTFTQNPYLIEELIAFCSLIIAIAGFLLIRKRTFS